MTTDDHWYKKSVWFRVWVCVSHSLSLSHSAEPISCMGACTPSSSAPSDMCGFSFNTFSVCSAVASSDKRCAASVKHHETIWNSCIYSYYIVPNNTCIVRISSGTLRVSSTQQDGLAISQHHDMLQSPLWTLWEARNYKSNGAFRYL